MTVDDIKQALVKYNFQHHYDDVEHWDRYTNKSYPVSIDNKVYNLFLEVSINYYNVQIIWYHTGWNKCTKIYYIHREIQQFETFEAFIESFLEYCTEMYRIKITDYKTQS